LQVLGFVIGLLVRKSNNALTPNQLMLIKFPGELLLNMLKVTIIPLMTSSLISGITTLDPRVS
jgi:Na+/H+-dicarboxylate symporter